MSKYIIIHEGLGTGTWYRIGIIENHLKKYQLIPFGQSTITFLKYFRSQLVSHEKLPVFNKVFQFASLFRLLW